MRPVSAGGAVAMCMTGSRAEPRQSGERRGQSAGRRQPGRAAVQQPAERCRSAAGARQRCLASRASATQAVMAPMPASRSPQCPAGREPICRLNSPQGSQQSACSPAVSCLAPSPAGARHRLRESCEPAVQLAIQRPACCAPSSSCGHAARQRRHVRRSSSSAPVCQVRVALGDLLGAAVELLRARVEIRHAVLKRRDLAVQLIEAVGHLRRRRRRALLSPGRPC